MVRCRRVAERIRDRIAAADYQATSVWTHAVHQERPEFFRTTNSSWRRELFFPANDGARDVRGLEARSMSGLPRAGRLLKLRQFQAVGTTPINRRPAHRLG